MNEGLQRLRQLVGDWDVTLTHAWFLDSPDTEIHGTATVHVVLQHARDRPDDDCQLERRKSSRIAST